MGFNYNALRYDTSDIYRFNDYDRYAFNLLDEHRFNPRWKSTVDLNYVIGNYEELPDVTLQNDLPDIALRNGRSSRDLKEYRMLLSVENDSITHNPLSLNYYFIDTNYDSSLRNDVYINQVRATWRRDFSPHLYTKLGVGPSYGKVEGSDADWGGNGIAELNYLMEHGFLNFTVDKRYEVQNFSGDYQRGASRYLGFQLFCWVSIATGSESVRKPYIYLLRIIKISLMTWSMNLPIFRIRILQMNI